MMEPKKHHRQTPKYAVRRRLRAERLSRGWTQTDVIERLRILHGFVASRSALETWERLGPGGYNPGVAAMIALARLFDTTVEDLVLGDKTLRPGRREEHDGEEEARDTSE